MRREPRWPATKEVSSIAASAGGGFLFSVEKHLLQPKQRYLGLMLPVGLAIPEFDVVS